MLWLIAALAPLALGPLCFSWLQKRPQWQSGLDGFLFITITGLVLFHLLPETIAHYGIGALALVLLGWWAGHLGESPAGVATPPLADAGSARPVVEAVNALPLEASSPAPVMSLINMVSGPELEAVIDLLEEGSQDGGLSI